MARMHKGDRLTVTSKIPRADAEKLSRVVEITSESRSELLARLLHDHLSTINFDELDGQESLPIAKAS
jgi:acyl-CoA thioesterase FadM